MKSLREELQPLITVPQSRPVCLVCETNPVEIAPMLPSVCYDCYRQAVREGTLEQLKARIKSDV